MLFSSKMPKRMRSDDARPSGRSKRQKTSPKRTSSRYNRKMVGQRETGFVDLASASYACDTTGSVTLIATIPQGSSVNQRIGKKVVLKSLQCRGQVQNGSTATANDVAILVVYDSRPTGALPAVTDILNTANPRSFNNDVNSDRFRILKRMDFAMVGTNAASSFTDCSFLSVDWFLKLKGRKMQFGSAGTGAIGDIANGAMYLVTVGSSAAGTAAATFTAGFRTRFVDV